MRGTQLRLRHLVGAAALSSSLLFGALTFASLPAGAQSAPATTTMASMACPTLSVGNPSPGDTLVPGAYIISGQAFDPAAPAGTSGVSRVELFLGLRDQGGFPLGIAVPGQAITNVATNSTAIVSTTTSNPTFFSIEVTIPANWNRGTTFSAYAESSVTGQETSVNYPVFVGSQPKVTGPVTPTPVLTITPNYASSCPTSSMASAPASAPMGTSPSMAASPAATAAPAMGGAATGATSACPVLSLANPNPGNDLTAGDMYISGTATGPTGVQRVDLFLGERDQGGLFLGSGVPGSGANGNPNAFNVLVTIPNLGRGLDFAAYAIGNNGQQTSVTFPVFVGTQVSNPNSLATATPVPTTETTSSTCGSM